MKCSPNTLDLLESFRTNRFRTHGRVSCTIATIFSEWFAWLLFIAVLNSYSTYMYEVLWNVPMTCSPARWWVPTPRTYSSNDSACICNHFAPRGMHITPYLLDLYWFMWYPIWICIMCVLTLQLNEVQPQHLGPSWIFSDQSIQDSWASKLHYRYYF